MRLFFFSLSIFLLTDRVLSSPPALSSISCKFSHNYAKYSAQVVFFHFHFPGQINSKNSLSEVLEMCQGVDILKAERYEFNGLSKADFNRLFWNVVKIRGWIEFTNTKITIMNFPRLDDIWDSNITIGDNPILKEVLFPVLFRFDTDFTHGLIIKNNPKLKKLDLPQIAILNWGPHRYENNTALKSIKFCGLRAAFLQSFVVIKNPALEIFEVNLGAAELNFRTREILRIEDNESLKEIIFRHKRGEQARWWILNEMRIVNNRNLVAVPGQFLEGNRTLTIRGNPQLSGKVLAELRAAANKNSSEIQEIGEPVRDLALLDICAYVYGQLELTASVEGSTSVRLDRVEGDVFASDVPIEKLQFLLNTDIYGKFESSLCDFDFSGFKAGRKGTKRGCQTTTTEESTTTGEGENRTRTTGTTTADKTTTVTLETDETTRTTESTPTTEIATTEAMTTITQETTETIITTLEISPETSLMTKETTIGSTTTEEMTIGSQSTASQEIIPTSPAVAPASSFPYRPIIIVFAVLLIFFILLGTVLWAKKTKIKKEKALKQELSSPSSQISTSSASSR